MTDFLFGPMISSTTGMSAANVAVTGSAAPANGLFLPATNNLGFATNSTQQMFVDANGNVGIGTTSTLNRLTSVINNAQQILLGNTVVDGEGLVDSTVQMHVRNASATANASSDLIATADNGSDTFNYVDLGINSSQYSVSGWTINGVTDGYLYASDGALAIGTANATIAKQVTFFTGGTLAANERMRINGSGQVGVGTITPSGQLHVQAASGTGVVSNVAANNWGFVAVTNGLNQSGIWMTSSNTGQVALRDNANNLVTIDTSTSNMQFSAGGSERMRITSTGNVGIGNTSVLSGFVLDVNGNINASGSIATTANSQQVATTNFVKTQGGFQAQVILTSGTSTWAVPSGVTKIKVTVIGGGGAGGGNPATVGAPGSGGGSGGLAVKYYTGVSGQFGSYSIGTGGNGVSNASGGNGLGSYFNFGGTNVIVNGGTGGTVGGAASTFIAGGAGATVGSGGDYNYPGNPGGNSVSSAAATTCASGAGAVAPHGVGGTAAVIKTTAGTQAGNSAPANTGGGGSGSAPGAATATVGTGGGGGSGIVIIEY